MTIRGLELLVAQQRAARGEPAMIAVAPMPAWLPADAPLPPGFGAPRVGEIIPTRAKVANEIRALDRDYACLDITIKTNPTDPANPQDAGFRQGWDLALGAWKKFVADNPVEGLTGLGVYATGTGNLIRSINDYRNTLVAWDTSFRQRYPGAPTSCPAPAPPGAVPGLLGVPAPATIEPTGSSLPWWATSALTVAAIGGVAYLGYATYKYVTEGSKDVEYVRREVIPRALRLPPRDREEREASRDEARDRYRYDDDPSPHLPYPT